MQDISHPTVMAMNSHPTRPPAGHVASAENYEEHSFTLAPGDTLTFFSDSVVEARNFQGELFGFERTRAISMQSADAIAATTQHDRARYYKNRVLKARLGIL